MTDIVPPQQAAQARRFRALVSAYESNRDLVLMGAYRAGADALLDRGIALAPALSAFMSQEMAECVPLPAAAQQLAALIGHE